jgi:phosphotransferase system HPr (HPr) family protein
MNEPLRYRLRVTAPAGLHLRTVAALAQTAAKFQSSIAFSLGERRADGKSPLDLMLLAAGQGEELHLEVLGDDACAATDAVVGLLTYSSWAELLNDPDGRAGSNSNPS